MLNKKKCNSVTVQQFGQSHANNSTLYNRLVYSQELAVCSTFGHQWNVINSQVIVLLEQQNTVYCRGIYSGNNVKVGDTIPD